MTIKKENGVLVQIIDDDIVTLKTLSDVLQSHGHRVITSDNGISGIEQFKHENPDIVLLDVQMSEMNGYEVCTTLRKPEFDPALPILMITGLEDVESINDAFRVGATDFISKPMNPALLGQRIKYALKGKEQYHEIQHKTNELAAILLSASDGIITTNLNNIILNINPAAENLFNISRIQIKDKDLSEFIPDLKAYDKNNNKHLTGRKSDGQTFPIDFSVNEVAIGDSSFKSYFIRDLTEQHKLEHMKGEFIQTISHELRTPIAAIKGAVGILNSGVLGDVSPDLQELINIPKKSCNQLEELVNDILDVSILEDPMESLDYEKIKADELLDVVLNDCNDIASDNNVELLVKYSPNLFLQADKKRLSKILGHLISNAIKFSPKGEKVLLKVVNDDSYIKFIVSDNGPGILDSNKEKIFAKFTQIDNSSTRHQGGTGLGLYIAKKAIEKMSGKIEVESKLNEGSTFIITLPKGK